MLAVLIGRALVTAHFDGFSQIQNHSQGTFVRCPAAHRFNVANAFWQLFHAKLCLMQVEHNARWIGKIEQLMLYRPT